MEREMLVSFQPKAGTFCLTGRPAKHSVPESTYSTEEWQGPRKFVGSRKMSDFKMNRQPTADGLAQAT